MSMLLRVPVPNAPAKLTDKVKAALLGQVSEVANQVGDGMLLSRTAMTLKSPYGLCGPSDVVSSIDHVFP